MFVELDTRHDDGEMRKMAVNVYAILSIGEVTPDWEPEYGEGFRTFIEVKHNTYFVRETVSELVKNLATFPLPNPSQLFLNVDRRITRETVAPTHIGVNAIAHITATNPQTSESNEGFKAIVSLTSGAHYFIKATPEELLQKIAYLKGDAA